MIRLEFVANAPKDPLLAAGHAAEEHMAHLLKRHFHVRADVAVFNGLRFAARTGDGDFAQIDHLVVHRGGMIIIESKSIHGEVKVDDRDEWVRLWNGKPMGMRSPLGQAREQWKALHEVLQAHKSELRDRKIFGLAEGGFKHCPVLILAAISDKSVIKRVGKAATEVCKPDEAISRTEAEIKRHAEGMSLKGWISDKHVDAGNWSMNPAEFVRTVDFIAGLHTPLRKAGGAAAKAAEAAPTESRARVVAEQKATAVPTAGRAAVSISPAGLRCKKCGSTDLVDHAEGRFGPYSTCNACKTNTAWPRAGEK